MILSGRNQTGLTESEIAQCVNAWEVLCGDRKIELVTTEAATHSSQTRFNESDSKVYLGADVNPGNSKDANSRMGRLACLAHELAHAERFELGFQRPLTLPDCLIDEAETSLHASFHSVLNRTDREDLIEAARDHLIHWLAEQQSGEEK
jgi:hypothetical protein